MDDALDIPDPVPIAVVEALGVDLVHDLFLPPFLLHTSCSFLCLWRGGQDVPPHQLLCDAAFGRGAAEGIGQLHQGRAAAPHRHPGARGAEHIQVVCPVPEAEAFERGMPR